MAIGTKRIEDYVPVVKYNEGIYTELDVTVATGATVTLPATTTIGGSAVVALGDITSSSTTATAFSVTNTGVYTGDAVVEFVADSLNTGVAFSISTNGQTSGTAMKITSTGTIITTGSLLTLTANSATTAAGLLRINGNALTDGKGLVIASSTTLLTSTGRLFQVSHTGNAGVNTIIAEVASAAADETVVFRVTASAALALGVALDITGALVTTGTLLDIGDADALTTGTGINLVSNSASNGTRTLLNIKNDNAAATGTTALKIVNDAPTSTNFFKIATFNTTSLWMSDGTSPDTALTATTGDILFNGDSGKAYYCDDGAGAGWTAL